MSLKVTEEEEAKRADRHNGIKLFLKKHSCFLFTQFVKMKVNST